MDAREPAAGDDGVRTVSGDLIEPPAASAGGRVPPRGTVGDGSVRVTDWSWDGSVRSGRLGLWLGAGLVGIGAFLVLRELFPALDVLVDAAALVGGLAALAGWWRERARSWLLYAGAVLVPLGLAGLMSAAGLIGGSGWGTLLMGGAFLAIAALRRTSGGRWGWQLVLGGILAIAGGVTVAGSYLPGMPSFGELLLAGLLLLVGGWVLLGALRR